MERPFPTVFGKGRVNSVTRRVSHLCWKDRPLAPMPTNAVDAGGAGAHECRIAACYSRWESLLAGKQPHTRSNW